jgi:hypothetical protein
MKKMLAVLFVLVIGTAWTASADAKCCASGAACCDGGPCC